MIVLETDLDSSLADFGPVLMGQTFDYNPMTTQNILYDVP